jgi:hypothetical protein
MAENKDLFRPTDPPRWRHEIGELLKRGYRVRRPSPHQVKIGPINYYPSTGTITTDPGNRRLGKGFEALLLVLGINFSYASGAVERPPTINSQPEKP